MRPARAHRDKPRRPSRTRDSINWPQIPAGTSRPAGRNCRHFGAGAGAGAKLYNSSRTHHLGWAHCVRRPARRLTNGARRYFWPDSRPRPGPGRGGPARAGRTRRGRKSRPRKSNLNIFVAASRPHCAACSLRSSEQNMATFRPLNRPAGPVYSKSQVRNLFRAGPSCGKR